MGHTLSPFYMNTTYYDNRNTVNSSKNSNHIHYIGNPNRKDVVLVEQDLDKQIQSEASAMEEQLEVDTAQGHIKYAHERPGSNGLFDATGEPLDMKEIQDEVRAHEGFVWRTIVSLKEEDAMYLGFDSKEKWEDAIRATMPEVSSHIGIQETNLRWVAAFHEKEGHPHVHIVWWDQSGQRTKGKINEYEMKNMKRTFKNEFYREEQLRLYQEKTANRDLLRDIAKQDMTKYVSMVKEIQDSSKDIAKELQAIGHVKNKIAPELYNNDAKLFATQLYELANMMPEKGRIAFKFMPEDVKEKAIEIADSFLGNIGLAKTMEGYFESVDNITKLNTSKEDALDKARDNAYKDIQKRVANLVLKSAAEINKRNFWQVDNKAVEKSRESFMQASGKPKQDLEEDIIKQSVYHMKVYGLKQNEAEKVLENWLPKIVHTKRIEDVNEIVSNVYQETKTIPIEQKVDYSIKADDINRMSNLLGSEFENPIEQITTFEPTLRTGEKLKGFIKGSELSPEYEIEVEEVMKGLYKSLRHSGISYKECDSVIKEWLVNNHISIDLDEIKSSIGTRTRVNEDEWKLVKEALSIKEDPWSVERKESLNSEKLKVIYENLKDGNLPKGNEDFVKKFITKTITNISHSEEKINLELEEWNERLPGGYKYSEDERLTVINNWKLNDMKNIQTFTSMLVSSGQHRDDILKRIKTFEKDEKRIEEISDYIRFVSTKLHQDRFVGANELKEAEQIINYEENIKTVSNRLKSYGMQQEEVSKVLHKWLSKDSAYNPEEIEKIVLKTFEGDKPSSNNYHINSDEVKRSITEVMKLIDKDIQENNMLKQLNDIYRSLKDVRKGVIPDERAIIIKSFIKNTLLHKVGANKRAIYKELNLWNKHFSDNMKFKEEETSRLIQDRNLFDQKTMKSVSSILVVAGFNKEAIFKKLNVLESDLETRNKLSEHIKNQAKNKKVELHSIAKTLNGSQINLDFPFNSDNRFHTSEANKEELVEIFKGSKLKMYDDEVVKNTGFWMNEALKQSGVSDELRKATMNSWAINNDVSLDINLNSDKNFIVGNRRWKEICENLNLGELKTPWTNKSYMVINKEKAQNNVNVLQKELDNVKLATIEQKQVLRDLIVKNLSNLSISKIDFKEKIVSFNSSLEKNLKIDSNEIDRQANEWERDDFDYIQKALRVENKIEQTIRDYTKVLKTLGLSDEQTKTGIEDWLKRADIKYPNEKIEPLIDKTLKTFNEQSKWGKVPFISKQNYKDLSDNLDVHTPYLWKPNFNAMSGWVRNLWKSIYRAVEEERVQGQAKAEMQQREIQKQQRAKIRNQNIDREESLER